MFLYYPSSLEAGGMDVAQVSLVNDSQVKYEVGSVNGDGDICVPKQGLRNGSHTSVSNIN